MGEWSKWEGRGGEGEITNLLFPFISLQLIPPQPIHISLSQPATPVGLKYDDLLGSNWNHAALSCLKTNFFQYSFVVFVSCLIFPACNNLVWAIGDVTASLLL